MYGGPDLLREWEGAFTRRGAVARASTVMKLCYDTFIQKGSIVTKHFFHETDQLICLTNNIVFLNSNLMFVPALVKIKNHWGEN